MKARHINGAWLTEEATEGETYLVTNGDTTKSGDYAGHTAIYTEVVPIKPDEFTTNNEAVNINGNPTVGFQSVYFGVAGDSVNMSFDIVDSEGVLQTQLDAAALGYPPILALPVLKVVNGDSANIVDEVYFSTTLITGVIAVTGSFPASGNWKLLTTRINAALSEIGATWNISKDDATFRINS